MSEHPSGDLPSLDQWEPVFGPPSGEPVDLSTYLTGKPISLTTPAEIDADMKAFREKLASLPDITLTLDGYFEVPTPEASVDIKIERGRWPFAFVEVAVLVGGRRVWHQRRRFVLFARSVVRLTRECIEVVEEIRKRGRRA